MRRELTVDAVLRTALLLSSVLAMSVATARAQDTAPAAPLRETTLSNGLRVIAKEAFAKDLIAVSLMVDGGNRTEPRELSGLSHYYEHLIFRGGTAQQAELETRKVFERLGEFSGYTTSDLTCYRFTCPRASLDESLRRFADAVMSVSVTAEKVAREREVVMSEYKMSYADSPSGWAWYNLARTAFTRHPYGRTTIGLREVIEGADLARFKTFYAERYVPNHIVIAVVGALPAEEAFARIGAAFGAFKPGKASFETGDVEPAQADTRVVIEARKTEKSYVYAGFRAPAAQAPDAYAVRVLAQILGGGASSRLEREVRAKKGLALDVGAWFDDTKDEGLFGLSATVEPGKEAAALAAMAAEAARMRREEVAPDELERARSALCNGWIFGNESYAQQAQTLTRLAIMGDPTLGESYVARVRGVTAADVRAAATRILASARATVSVVRPESAPALEEKAVRYAIVQCDVNAAPDAAAPKAVPQAVSRTARTVFARLKNGVRVIAREDFSAPIVAMTVELASPLACEHPDEPGAAALGERLLLRGAGDLDREQFAARIDALGIRLDTSLDFDNLSATLDAPAERFRDGLALLADALLRPRFDPEEVRKAAVEQIAAIAGVDDRSFDLVGRESYAQLYEPASLYGRPLMGTPDGVRSASRIDIEAWRLLLVNRHPERIVVAVVGAIAPERAIEAVRGKFETDFLEGGPIPPHDPLVPPKIATPRANPVDVLLDRPREQVAFRLAFVGIPVTDPDWIPLQLGVRRLSSDIFFHFVYEKGMAYRAWTYLRAGRGANPFTFEMGVSARNYAEARAGLEDALKTLVEKGITQEELERARSEALSRHALSQETSLEQASLLAFNESIGLGWERVDQLPALYRAATLAEVNVAIRKHLDPVHLRVAVVGDLKAAGIAESGEKR